MIRKIMMKASLAAILSMALLSAAAYGQDAGSRTNPRAPAAM